MIIDNKVIKLKEVLKEWVEKSDEVLICSPFISYNDVLFELIENKFKMTLICRLSYPASPELFTKLHNFRSPKSVALRTSPTSQHLNFQNNMTLTDFLSKTHIALRTSPTGKL